MLSELEKLHKLTGKKIDDLHKHVVDELEINAKSAAEMAKRIPDVLDCWFESGSMPYAQVHYPFENKKWFEKNFPAEFIAEGVDQTRGWFYTLMVFPRRCSTSRPSRTSSSMASSWRKTARRCPSA